MKPIERSKGALLGHAVGNVLGIPWEGFARDVIGDQPVRVQTAEADRPPDDDLAMALVLGAHLLEHPDGIEPAALLHGYIHWMKENGRGIGGLTRQVLALADEGAPDAAEGVWRERGGREGVVLGNGSVMRCPPIGIRWRDEPVEVIEQAQIDSALTHWDERCRWAEAATAVLIAGIIAGADDPVGETVKLLQQGDAEAAVLEALTIDAVGPGFPETARLDGYDAGSCLLALRLARWAAEHGLDFRKSLTVVLQAGGDTDTNGAVVGAILGARFPDEIPEEWLECIPIRPEIEKVAGGLCRMADERK